MKKITLKNVRVRFKEHVALDIPALEIGSRVKLAVMGESGSGKSTLLNILCALEEINCGMIFWNNTRIDTLNQMQKDKFRYDKVGLVMQDFYLYSGLSALQNVLLPVKFHYLKIPKPLVFRAVDLLKRLNITQYSKNIDTMSRGEKQRVAIARALINSPQVIIADEPTASLDTQNSLHVTKLLLSLADEMGSALICATHDNILSNHLTHHLWLEKDKKIEAFFA
ncbi:MAG: ATP-binding cassette domain-containing protein [Campylobacteraceae bacterium]|jgi:putative ABC transport system ATP-binding protein|nr:ATP-binding cassette domain-containing protein [Campylobacteraceae bacterium]